MSWSVATSGSTRTPFAPERAPPWEAAPPLGVQSLNSVSIRPRVALPPRIYIPIVAVLAVLFLGVMGYFLRIGFGTTARVRTAKTTPEQGMPASRQRPSPKATDPPGTVDIPQTGSGPMRQRCRAAPATAGRRASGASRHTGRRAARTGDADAHSARRAGREKSARPRGARRVGESLFRRREIRRAISYFKRARARSEQSRHAHRLSGRAACDRARSRCAAEDRTVLAAAKNFPQALFDRGVVLGSIGRRSEAVVAFENSCGSRPRTSTPRMRAAMAKIWPDEGLHLR